MRKREARVRGHLKRTKKNYRKSPTPGRLLAIERYERYLGRCALERIAEAQPDASMTVREALEYLQGYRY